MKVESMGSICLRFISAAAARLFPEHAILNSGGVKQEWVDALKALHYAMWEGARSKVERNVNVRDASLRKLSALDKCKCFRFLRV